MVINNMKLVSYLARRYSRNSFEIEDLISVGTIGLIKASIKYDEARGKFGTYAARCITNEIFMFLRRKKYKVIVSLDGTLPVGLFGDEVTLLDTVASPNSNVEEEIVRKEDIKTAVEIILNCFKPRDAKILLNDIAGISQKETAKWIGISQSYVSRLTRKTRTELAEYMEGKKYSSSNLYTVQVTNEIEISKAGVVILRRVIDKDSLAFLPIIL